jgi:hypothetical protein
MSIYQVEFSLQDRSEELMDAKEKTMVTVSIEDKYVEALTAFGDIQAAVGLALQRYTIEQITAKIAQLRQRAAEYQAKYGLDYSTFVHRVAEDESFVHAVETNVSPTWEIDLADWEFCTKGIEDWTHNFEMEPRYAEERPPLRKGVHLEGLVCNLLNLESTTYENKDTSLGL